MSSKKFTRATFTWLHQINGDAALSGNDVKVALRLTWHFNEDDDGGRAFPAYKTIAEEIGLSEHSVIRSVRRLHERGHLRVEWGQQGRGHPNQYWKIVKPASVQVSKAAKPASVKPASVQIKPAPAQETLLTNHRASKEAPMERETRTCAMPIGGALDAPPIGKKPAREERGQPVESQEAFDELRTIWARPWADDVAADRRAFALACLHADPDDILDGARVWAAAVAPRFLPSLEKWLGAKRWEVEPPRRRCRPSGGRGGGSAPKPRLWR